MNLFDLSTIQVLSNCSCVLGEGPHWDYPTQALAWVDILQSHVYLARDGAVNKYPLSFMPSVIWKIEDNHVLFASDSGICALSIRDGSQELVLPIEADEPDTRSNDGGCAPDGSFWFGTMLRQPFRKGGNIYRVSAEMAVTKVFEEVGIPNTFLFRHPSNDILIGDSFDQRIYRHSFDGRALVREAVWLEMSNSRSVPDGSCLLPDGTVINAEWDGGKIVAYDPNGIFVAEQKLPVSRPTSCVLGGKHNDTLFITSARDGLTKDQLAREPLAGATFELKIHPKRAAWSLQS